jgi:hypothetical protein
MIPNRYDLYNDLVLGAYAVVDPGTVVVVNPHTPFADAAVSRPRGFYYLHFKLKPCSQHKCCCSRPNSLSYSKTALHCSFKCTQGLSCTLKSKTRNSILMLCGNTLLSSFNFTIIHPLHHYLFI